METEISDRLKKEVAQKLKGNWAELARRTGLKPSTLQQVKTGADPRLSTLKRIAEGLGVGVACLLKEEKNSQYTEVNEFHAPYGPPPGVEQLADIQAWLNAWWKSASPEERVWLKVQMRRCFPEFGEFKRSDGE